MLLFTSWTKIVSFFLTALFPFHYSLSSSFIKASFKSMLEIPLNKDLVFADLQWKGWCILWHFKITRIRGSFFFNLSTSFILCLHSTADWPPLWGQLSSSHWMLQMNTKTGLTEKREIRNNNNKKKNSKYRTIFINSSSSSLQKKKIKIKLGRGNAVGIQTGIFPRAGEGAAAWAAHTWGTCPGWCCCGCLRSPRAPSTLSFSPAELLRKSRQLLPVWWGVAAEPLQGDFPKKLMEREVDTTYSFTFQWGWNAFVNSYSVGTGEGSS